MGTTPLEKYQELAAKLRASGPESISGKTVIQVGNATCENAAGSRQVLAEFKKHLQSSGRDDVIIREVGCTGRCSCEPIVSISSPGHPLVKYQEVNATKAHQIFLQHVIGGEPASEYILDAQQSQRSKYEFYVCGEDKCIHNTKGKIYEKFTAKLAELSIDTTTARLIPATCLGLCGEPEACGGAHLLVVPGEIVYKVQDMDDVQLIIDEHILKDQVVESLKQDEAPLAKRFFETYGDQNFFNRQTRIALRNAGIINPESLDEYMQVDGFVALSKCLSDKPEKIIEAVTASKLRGRGGGGFPTGIKWGLCAKEVNDTKYIICNADEGDPGAFMDRSMLESDPYSVIEGMIIGAYGMACTQGYFYVRAEYPLAIKRLEHAIDECRKNGLLGENILGSGFSFDLEIRLGAGAFVCGEETALIHSIEGQRGEPSIRPPYPTTAGLFGKPTCINNVETFANVSAILLYGESWFSHIGTEKSGGTKVFALAGKVNHTGLVEVPMGTTLREIVYDIGGGVPGGKKLKAIQTGGPAGGCLPAKWLDTPVDFDSLMASGSIMGSGGMIVMDESDCMVDIAKFFLTFSQDESCGKCTPCREGTKRMLEILERITTGRGVPEDIDKLKRLGNLMKKTSLCGLGRAASNPVLSTITHYLDEYEAHVNHKRCPSHKCSSLVSYDIDIEACTGCTMCAKKCPANCISGERKKLHVIDQDQCIKCGHCYTVCRFDAVIRT